MKSKFVKCFGASILLATSISTQAVERSGYSAIASMYAYAKYGKGDLYVSLDVNGTTCQGYWVNKDSVGYELVVSTLSAAYFAGKSVRIQADELSKWSGSSQTICEINYVELLK